MGPDTKAVAAAGAIPLFEDERPGILAKQMVRRLGACVDDGSRFVSPQSGMPASPNPVPIPKQD
jgi:hypothetical protein